jgi:DNA-binding response OmpR family regulator
MLDNPKQWVVAIVAMSKFDGGIVADLLRDLGARVHLFVDSEQALASLDRIGANIAIVAVDAKPISGEEWVRRLRRETVYSTRKSPVFMLAPKLTVAIAEMCRHAGANAVIGMPVSSAVLINTIKKVLAKPRPFIDAEGYVGPCRRAGIVTAGNGSRRRKADDQAAARAP